MNKLGEMIIIHDRYSVWLIKGAAKSFLEYLIYLKCKNLNEAIYYKLDRIKTSVMHNLIRIYVIKDNIR